MEPSVPIFGGERWVITADGKQLNLRVSDSIELHLEVKAGGEATALLENNDFLQWSPFTENGLWALSAGPNDTDEEWWCWQRRMVEENSLPKH